MMVKLRMGDRFLYFVLLWCLCSYKVLLGGVGEAGWRVDDLLLAAAFVLLLLRGDLRRMPRSAALQAYLCFLAVNLISALWNGWRGRVPVLYGLLFTARLAEYLLFYAMGWVLCTRGAKLWSSFRWYFYALCVVVPLQTVGVLKVASQFNANRASGNTNGPYELAVVAAFFICIFGYEERKKLSTLAAVLMMALTASRGTFAGTAMGYARRALRQKGQRVRALLLASALVLAALGASVWMEHRTAGAADNDALGSRLQSGSQLTSVAEARLLWDAAPVYANENDYYAGTFLDAADLRGAERRRRERHDPRGSLGDPAEDDAGARGFHADRVGAVIRLGGRGWLLREGVYRDGNPGPGGFSVVPAQAVASAGGGRGLSGVSADRGGDGSVHRRFCQLQDDAAAVGVARSEPGMCVQCS